MIRYRNKPKLHQYIHYTYITTPIYICMYFIFGALICMHLLLFSLYLIFFFSSPAHRIALTEAWCSRGSAAQEHHAAHRLGPAV